MVGDVLQVVGTAPEGCSAFSSESIYAGNFDLENYLNELNSSLNDCCKRKDTPQNGKMKSSILVLLHFRPGRATGPYVHRNS